MPVEKTKIVMVPSAMPVFAGRLRQIPLGDPVIIPNQKQPTGIGHAISCQVPESLVDLAIEFFSLAARDKCLRRSNQQIVGLVAISKVVISHLLPRTIGNSTVIGRTSVYIGAVLRFNFEWQLEVRIQSTREGKSPFSLPSSKIVVDVHSLIETLVVVVQI